MAAKTKFSGKILIVGLGGVSRCTFPLLLKHLDMDPANLTVMDFVEVENDVRAVKAAGAKFVKDKITRENMAKTLAKYVGKGDILVE